MSILLADTVRLHPDVLGSLWIWVSFPLNSMFFFFQQPALTLSLEDCLKAARLSLPKVQRARKNHLEVNFSPRMDLIMYTSPLPVVARKSEVRLYLKFPCRMLGFCMKSPPTLACPLWYLMGFSWKDFLNKSCVHNLHLRVYDSGDTDVRHCLSFLQMRKPRLGYFKLPKVTLPIKDGVVI